MVRSSIRIGLGRTTTTEQVDVAAEAIIAAVRSLRAARSGAVRAASRA